MQGIKPLPPQCHKTLSQCQCHTLQIPDLQASTTTHHSNDQVTRTCSQCPGFTSPSQCFPPPPLRHLPCASPSPSPVLPPSPVPRIRPSASPAPSVPPPFAQDSPSAFPSPRAQDHPQYSSSIPQCPGLTRYPRVFPSAQDVFPLPSPVPRVIPAPLECFPVPRMFSPSPPLCPGLTPHSTDIL